MTVLEFDCRFAYPSGFSLELAFRAGSGVTGLVGPSGVGKTTVLNLIAGLLRPNRGKIVLHDRVLFDAAKSINLRPDERGIGYVFQDYMLFPHLRVGDNLRYGYRRRKSAGLAIEQVASTLKLTDLLERMPASLSGGQKQRVALGRAVLCNPRLLLLDEALNAVDRELRANIVEYLERIVAEFNVPTLLVSHDQANIAALTSTVVTMAESLRAPNTMN
jgi:molybdate transport system ATP-binding protein